MPTARARPGEDIDLLVLALEPAADRRIRLLLLLRVGADEPEVDVLLARAAVRAHVPLGVRHAPDELEEGVARGVVEPHGERAQRRVLLGRLLRLHGLRCVRVRLVFVVGEDLLDAREHRLDLGVCGLVLDPPQGLVLAEVGGDVPQEALDGRELPAVWGDGELELGDRDGAGLGLDELAVEVVS